VRFGNKYFSHFRKRSSLLGTAQLVVR
jgi:hypothetical protein